MPQEAVLELEALIGKIANQANRQGILEHFKRYFARAAGTTTSRSTSESWAESDLRHLISAAAENAPLFIEAFYEGCEALRSQQDLTVPDAGRINRVLAEYNVGYQLQPPEIVAVGIHQPIPVPARYSSLDELAQETVQQSLYQSEKLLAEGQPRQAVQEILWLMETVSTAFRGMRVGNETVEAKYFNKIAQELRANSKGQAIDQVLNWLTTLHGYLSSPTGGGVRHGADLTARITINADEGRLYCNLIRSYVTFLMAEHARMSGGGQTQG